MAEEDQKKPSPEYLSMLLASELLRNRSETLYPNVLPCVFHRNNLNYVDYQRAIDDLKERGAIVGEVQRHQAVQQHSGSAPQDILGVPLLVNHACLEQLAAAYILGYADHLRSEHTNQSA